MWGQSKQPVSQSWSIPCIQYEPLKKPQVQFNTSLWRRTQFGVNLKQPSQELQAPARLRLILMLPPAFTDRVVHPVGCGGSFAPSAATAPSSGSRWQRVCVCVCEMGIILISQQRTEDEVSYSQVLHEPLRKGECVCVCVCNGCDGPCARARIFCRVWITADIRERQLFILVIY